MHGVQSGNLDLIIRLQKSKAKPEIREEAKQAVQKQAIADNANFFNKMALGRLDGLLGTTATLLLNIMTFGSAWSGASIEEEVVLNGVRGAAFRDTLLATENSTDEKTKLNDRFKSMDTNELNALSDLAVRLNSETYDQLKNIFSMQGRYKKIVLLESEDKTQKIYVKNCVLFKQINNDEPAELANQNQFIAYALDAARIQYGDGADLEYADFRKLDCANLNFSSLYLRGARFEGVNLTQSVFTNSNLSFARFNNPGEGTAESTPTIFENVHFMYAKMQHVQMSGVDVSDASFFMADLRYSELRSIKTNARTNFNGADFTHADITSANFTKARKVADNQTIKFAKGKAFLPQT